MEQGGIVGSRWGGVGRDRRRKKWRKQYIPSFCKIEIKLNEEINNSTNEQVKRKPNTNQSLTDNFISVLCSAGHGNTRRDLTKQRRDHGRHIVPLYLIFLPLHTNERVAEGNGRDREQGPLLSVPVSKCKRKIRSQCSKLQ